MEDNIWQVHCKWTQWDSTSQHPRHSSAIFISHRHSQRFILQRTKLAKKEHSIWQVHCKWTQWDSTSQHPDTPLLSSSHTDTHNASSCSERNWRRRSTAFDKCIASEHSETRLLNILTLLCYLHLTQTLTTLNLERNEIGDEGAQHLARALKVNRVRLDFSTSRHSSAIFISHRHCTTLHLAVNEIGEEGAQHLASALQVNTVRLDFWTSWHSSAIFLSHRHSQRFILIGTVSAMMEDNIWQVHCKWTQWDSTSQHHRHSSAIFISHRHSQRFILQRTKLAKKEHSIWQVHCKWTQWDSTSQHPDTPLLSSSHTDTHNASSCSERNWRRRSTAFDKCIASELDSETRLLNILTLLCYLHLTQTLTTLNLERNEIGDEGAQHLARALKVNRVRLDFSTSRHSSAIFISHRHSQRLILIGTVSAMMEDNIWQVHCKWTQWDSTSEHPDTPLLSSSHTDTHNA